MAASLKTLREQVAKGQRKAKGDWVSLGGKARNHMNLKTGEVISRREYDETYGSLAKENLTYEKKAKKNKAEAPEIAAARPARGRKTKDFDKREKEAQKLIRHPAGKDFKQIRPPRTGKFRMYEIPLTLEAIADFRRQIEKNPRVYSVGIPNLQFYNADGTKTYSHRIIPMRRPDDFEDAVEIYELCEEAESGEYGMSGEVVAVSVAVAVSFK